MSIQMKPWAKDAGSTNIGELVDEDRKRDKSRKLVVTPDGHSSMRDFVSDPGLGSKLRVVVAPKGYGKTLLLRYRAQWLRQRYDRSGVVFFPSGANDLEYLEVLLDVQEMYRIIRPIKGPFEWARIWECAILVTACYASGSKTIGSTELDQLFPYKPSELTLSNVLATVLLSMDSRDSLLSSDIATLRTTFKSMGKEVVIFADNADEAFRFNQLDDMYGKRRSRPSKPADNAKEGSYDFAQDNVRSWKDLQSGLLLAIRSLDRHTKGLHLYTSLRAEALNDISDATLLQAKDHCVDLRYSKESLKKIFESNIGHYARDDLANPTAEHPMQRWLGVDCLPHRFVKNPADNPQVEDIFDFILRHSLLSPRDLMVFGEAIDRDVGVDPNRNPETLSSELQDTINSTAHNLIFKQWQQTAIPRWSDHYYMALGNVGSNVLTAKELEALDNLVDEALADKGERVIPFSVFMYEHGLLGHSRKVPHSPYQQLFQASWQQKFSGMEEQSTANIKRLVPRADHYFIHPLLNNVVRHYQADGVTFTPNRHNVVGYDHPFYSEKPLLVVKQSEGAWPCVRYQNDILFDGSKPLTQPQQGLLALAYAAKDAKSKQVPIGAVIASYTTLCKRFGAQHKDWLDSLKNDSSHLNSSLKKLIGKDYKGSVASCMGKDHSKSLPAYIHFELCEVDDIYIEPSVLL